MSKYNLIHANCREVLHTLPSRTFDAVITDPPYPEIERDYGRMTEKAWTELMTGYVVPQCMRLLKRKGSAIFILQPNHERMGKMRNWLLEFQLWCSKKYGIVQDLYWWNIGTMPTSVSTIGGLCRPSVKLCVWVGPEDCYRDQDSIVIEESNDNKNRRERGAANKTEYRPCGYTVNPYRSRKRSLERGGVTPFNLFPIGNTDSSKGSNKHPASTPRTLCDTLIHYLCPPGGNVLDPFSGGGTVGQSATSLGMNYTGIERIEKYHKMAVENLEATEKKIDVTKYKHRVLLADPEVPSTMNRYSL